MRPAVVVAILAGAGVALAVAMSQKEDKQPVLGAPAASDRTADGASGPIPAGGDATSTPEGCGDAWFCLAAGDADAAYQAAVGSDDPTLACVAAAVAGRDEAAAAAGGAAPRCLAARCWALVQAGDVDKALLVASPLRAGPTALARAAALQAAGLDAEAEAAVLGAGKDIDTGAVPHALVDALTDWAETRQKTSPGNARLAVVRAVLTRLSETRAPGDSASRQSEAWSTRPSPGP